MESYRQEGEEFPGPKIRVMPLENGGWIYTGRMDRIWIEIIEIFSKRRMIVLLTKVREQF